MAEYATTGQLIIRIQQQSVPSAAQLAMMTEILDAASRSIDRICRRPDDAFIAAAAASHYFTSEGEEYLHIDRCMTVTQVAVKSSVAAATYTTWTTPTAPMAGDGDWIPCRGDHTDPVFGRTPYDLLIIDPGGDYSEFLDGGRAPVCMVTATWGSVLGVPPDIREACLMQSAIWLKQFQGAMASELASESFGRITYRRSMDNSVKQILIDGGWVVPLYGGA